MTSRYRHRRALDAVTVFPNPLEQGEIAVNTFNRQIVVGDESSGAPIPLLAVRYFDSHAVYAKDDLVAQAGIIYRANAANGPGAFNPVHWTAGGTQLVVSDTAPAPNSMLPGSMFWESDTGILYVLYDDGDSTAWIIASPQPDISQFIQKAGDSMGGPLYLATDPTLPMQAATKQYADAGDAVAVKYNAAQSLTAAQQVQARQNIFAAPIDAMAFSGLQLNGAFEISQQFAFGTAANGTSRTRLCDEWNIFSGTGTHVIAASIQPMGFPGLPKGILLSVVTANPSPAAGDVCIFQNNVEGYRTRRLQWGTANAQPITIGIWTAHHRPGLYSLNICNGDGSRSYTTTYTQNVADTPEFKVVTIPGCPDGAWSADTGVGLSLRVGIAAGTTYTASAVNAWLTTNTYQAPGAINGVANTTDVMRFSGVMILPGIEAPPAARAPLILRPYDQEMLLCRRHCRLVLPEGAGAPNSATTVFFHIRHEGMRIAPIPSMTAPLGITDITTANSTQSSPAAAANNNYPDAGLYSFPNFTGLTPARLYMVQVQGLNPTPYLILDAGM